MSVEELWQELESQQAGLPGLARRRVREDSERNLFIGVHHPDLLRTLILAVDPAAVVHVEEPPTTRAMRTEIATGDGGQIELRVTLVISEMARVFTPFVDDVLDAVADAATDADAVDAFLVRFSHWKRLLAGPDSEGLGSVQAQGLYGELWTLRYVLFGAVPEAEVIAAWTGPDRQDRDFALGSLAIETKTTISDNPLTVAISNERQLDLAAFTRLFLVALALDALPSGGGQTLNELVDEIRSEFGSDEARLLFRDKLLSYGYAAAHRTKYDGTRYSLRELAIYEVKEGFPRLVEADMPGGVGEVRYLLALTACEPWRCAPEVLRDAVAGGAA